MKNTALNKGQLFILALRHMAAIQSTQLRKMKISRKQVSEIKEGLPSIQRLIEREETDYKVIFISVFDHWLAQNEFEHEIHTNDQNELKTRRDKLSSFILKLYELTPTYSWKYKRKSRFYIFPITSKKQIVNKCQIQNQNGESGQRYDILLPEIESIYSEEWDWTNVLWFRNKEKIEPVLELAKSIGLYVLEK